MPELWPSPAHVPPASRLPRLARIVGRTILATALVAMATFTSLTTAALYLDDRSREGTLAHGLSTTATLTRVDEERVSWIRKGLREAPLKGIWREPVYVLAWREAGGTERTYRLTHPADEIVRKLGVRAAGDKAGVEIKYRPLSHLKVGWAGFEFPGIVEHAPILLIDGVPPHEPRAHWIVLGVSASAALWFLLIGWLARALAALLGGRTARRG